MMDVPLSTWLLFTPTRHHLHSEIVSRLPTGEIHRYHYGDFAFRAQQLMNALDTLGVERGAHVATLAWNDYRHLEAYFGVPCAGRVLHTLNVRLSADELAFVMNDADDRVVLVDRDFLPLLEQVLPEVPGVQHVIVLGESTDGAPEGALAYESLLTAEPGTYPQVPIDERSPAGICYTSGTTGRAKGVVYSHRSTFLHALAGTSKAGLAIGPGDCVLPQVPMFHANAWGMPYASVAVGAKLVFFAGAFAPEPFADLLLGERVTVTGAVPTVWIGLADTLASRPRPEHLDHIVCGGSQPPRALIERYQRDFGVDIIQAWGMTETSPLASTAWPQERMRDWDPAQVMTAARGQAGLPLPGVEISIRDESGHEVPFDGETMGALHVRGPWVTDGYLHGHGADSFTEDGFFNTGDVAIGSPDGYFVIADRTKDLIKSGGEWISSVDMEAAIMAMPGVQEAAVVAIPDEKWMERPLAYVVPAAGETITADAVRAHLGSSGFASWQLPDRVEFIDEIPKTAVGKFDKKVLRAKFQS
ncbi:long-chain fatty acid--CoA ligase [Acidiferrimicrobium sp. IK]|uniref:long-chain fatty acid--CoA ligase n=1 Tax=Acidiferrimicrobium sp. IK TaxID=2871700 RepID=UPI0021CB2EDB|nr:long-chain fatty acid--CoA ligase [Acidiferrimicrobium sp. IK]MCU4187032.1 long-chain fatty acid--CoA ligase [Acidiferrimicrobium sp. IK]